MADSPPDKVDDIDVTQLNAYEAKDYRQELIHALRHPVLEMDVTNLKTDREFYHKKLTEVDAYLATFDS